MDRIAERVIHYMSDIDSSDDKNPHFAIAMYGEWGSGKTHYCETSLREALKRKKYKLVRISLFGLDSPNGIYGRLLSALCRMEGSKAKRMGKLAAETVANTFIATLHDHGIDLALDTETLVSLIPAEKTLIVLDDGERVDAQSEGQTPSWVIGTVNNMVENLHWHVMLIRNTPFDLEKGQTEKIIGEQQQYMPTAEELYDAMIQPHLEHQDDLDLDVNAAVIAGIQASGIRNARAAARIVDSLDIVLGTKAICNTAFASSGRQQALADVIQQMMLAASGNAPTEPIRDKDKIDHKQYWHDALLFQKFKELKDIVEPTAKGNVPESHAVDRCLELYLKTEYPASPEDQAIKNLEDALGNYPLMDDTEMANLASEFHKKIVLHAFGPQWIYQLWKNNKLILKLGFGKAMPLSDTKQAIRQIIDSNPTESYDVLYNQYSIWIGQQGAEQDGDLDELLVYAKQKAQESYKAIAANRGIDAEAGSRLAKELTDIMNSPLPSLNSISSHQFVEIFLVGNAQSQIALHNFFRAELLHRFSLFDRQCLSSWLEAIETELSHRHLSSQMGKLRQEWLLNDIHDIKSNLAIAMNDAQNGGDE